MRVEWDSMGSNFWLSLGNYGKQSRDEQIRPTESEYFVVCESNILSFLFWTWKTSNISDHYFFGGHFSETMFFLEENICSLIQKSTLNIDQWNGYIACLINFWMIKYLYCLRPSHGVEHELHCVYHISSFDFFFNRHPLD